MVDANEESLLDIVSKQLNELANSLKAYRLKFYETHQNCPKLDKTKGICRNCPIGDVKL